MKSKELEQELEESFKRKKFKIKPFCRYKEYKAMPQENFDIVLLTLIHSHA